jgi:ABC-type branched-subunit amino acid transport system ATPase component
MAERRRAAAPGLEIAGLNVYYGASHALQGVNLTLETGVLSVVGRNGMGKSTLCNAIMGLVRVESGSIRFNGEQLAGRTPSEISQLGIGYVPQGRRLWRSLTVDEHLRLVGAGRRGAWTIERIYSTFPRLAERKNNSGGQLSGGEQQMLAIGRALITNPKLLIMDEPTEGLAPLIVSQVEDMLLRIGEQGEIDVLVIEQNIHVATTVSERVGIMMNGRIGRIIDSAQLAADRELQQRLLGVGRHVDGERELDGATLPVMAAESAVPASAPTKIYIANPVVPNRWTKPVPVRQIEQAARTITGVASGARTVEQELRALAAPGESVVLVAGTLDTKGEELRYIRDLIQKAELGVRMVDLSTTGRHTGADIPAHQVAAYHPRGASGVFV